MYCVDRAFTRARSLILWACSGLLLGLASGAGPRELLLDCWNELYDATPNTFAGWLAGQPTRLYLVDVWWSHRSAGGPEGPPLTIFTMASMDRLPMLEAQCRGYVGPLSAAIYLPLPTRNSPRMRKGASTAAAAEGGADGRAGQRRGEPATEAGAAAAASVVLEEHGEEIGKARARLQAFFDQMESLRAAAAAAAAADGSGSGSAGACELRLMLFAERTADAQLSAIMPTNALRNAAGLAAQTPLAAMLDADLGASASLNALVRNASWIGHLMSETTAPRPALCVPPAYEANPRLDNDTAHRVSDVALAGSKADVTALWGNATLKVFHVDGCRPCHRPINHGHWAHTAAPYTVDFQRTFEPWGILSRFQDPGYDERFRGWCFDKMQHVESLARLRNFRFVVLPDVWLIHRPHEKVAIATLQRHHHQQEAKKSAQVNVLLETVQLPDGRSATAYKLYTSHVGALMRRERSALSQGTGYALQLNPQLAHCRKVLPWWRRS